MNNYDRDLTDKSDFSYLTDKFNLSKESLFKPVALDPSNKFNGPWFLIQRVDPDCAQIQIEREWISTTASS